MSLWSLPTIAALVAATMVPTGAVAHTSATTSGGIEPYPVASVNTFLGTKDAAPDFGHGGGAGMNFPGAVLPFGMMQWSPDTVTNAGGGYKYEDNRLRGFSMTHISGPGCTGAQDFPVIPFSGPITTSPATHGGDYVQTFKHENESATPGSYTVTLDSGVKSELAVTQRAGVGRFTFPAGKPGTVLINTSGSVNGVDDGETKISGNTISGWVQTGGFCGTPMRYKVYFHATFDQPVTAYGTWKDDVVRPFGLYVANASEAKVGTEALTPRDVIVNGPGSGAYFQFDPAKPVQMRVGLSYVSVDGARKNMETEVGTTGYDSVSLNSASTWNDKLSQVLVSGGTAAQRTTFYSNLYHALLQPHVAEDADGTYTASDNKVRTVPAGRHHYATFSGWDVYRSEVQLLALLDPAVGSDIAQSMYENAHLLGDVWDRWSLQNEVTGVMVGDPYHSIVSSLYAFGARNFDAADAMKSMVTAAQRTGGKDIGNAQILYDERPGNAAFMNKGYVVSDPSMTLEYGIADFGIAQLASRLGYRDVSATFMKRSQSWQNTYNAANSWIQPRMSDGSFISPFDPASPDNYIEGNGAQYHWMVQHNPRGLFDAMGGNSQVIPRLDAYFKSLNAGPNQPYAYMGNEPSLPSPWLYAWAGQPYKTQDLVRRVQSELFKATPDGLVGNDDLGAMASWYVWSAMGLFPAIPGRSELLVNTPLFDKINIKRPTGNIDIYAPSSTNRYIQSLKVNNVTSAKAWLPESFALQGGRLDFTTATTPNTSFGAAAGDAPPTFNDGAKPYLVGMDPGSGPVEPGGTFYATIAAQSAGAAQTLAWKATPPSGVTVTPASGTLTVPAGGKATLSLRMTVATGAALGFVTVPVTIGNQSASARLNVAKRGTPEWAHNLAGIGDDAESGLANFDAGAFSYSAQQLAAAGLRPGAQVTSNGMTFTWPNRKPGEWDNIKVGTAPIEVSAPAGVTKMAFLGSGTGGWPQVKATVTYTDGTTSTGQLGLSDWMMDFGGGQPQFGNQIVAATPYQLYNGSWMLRPLGSYVFSSQPIALTAGKKIKSIAFSPSQSGSMHIFTWAFS